MATISASSLVDQVYTLTDSAVSYQIPEFTADPAWCDISYSFSVTHSNGVDAISFNGDPTVRSFTFNYATDLLLAGSSSIDYEVTVTGETGITVKEQSMASFTLTLKNPCIDPGFVSIQKSALTDQRYELFEHDPIGF